jgi:hypothetical protein
MMNAECTTDVQPYMTTAADSSVTSTKYSHVPFMNILNFPYFWAKILCAVFRHMKIEMYTRLTMNVTTETAVLCDAEIISFIYFVKLIYI